jgi:hypothetical protein
VPPADSKIDDLYKGPPGEFVAGRAALAKTLTGAEARRVKGLQKPTVVPWAVNQVYWHARPVYDRLVSSGEKLRAAQIDALKGRSADVRRATDAHRKAMADAVAEAVRLASGAGVHPGADDLTKTLEAISLAREAPEPPGRLTRPLQPAGFEALAGVPVKARLRPSGFGAAGSRRPSGFGAQVTRPEAVPQPRAPFKLAQPAKSVERKRKAEEQRKKQAIERAAASADRAKAAEARARAAWERAKQALTAAELALSALQRT